MRQLNTHKKLNKECKQYSKILILTSFIFLLFGLKANAQEYDEFPVQLIVRNLGVTDIPVAIKDQEAYISVTDLFDYLTLKYEVGTTPAEVSGFIINPSNSYNFNISQSFVTVKDVNYPLTQDDYILTPTTLYLKSIII